MTLEGLIFNIQRYSVHDGPGIRTTVFMKGCPLKCLWCANPESQAAIPQIMVRNAKCTGCGACADACPKDAITIFPDKGRHIDWGRCDQCLACAGVCVYNAISVSGTKMGIDEVMEEVVRDRVFYENTGGGMTVSGGEPLNQAEFTAGLLEACKNKGLHTAVDTSGYGKTAHLKTLLSHTDLVLFDIKHLHADIHIRLTNVDNRLILENLKTAARQVRTWIRIPLVAGINDTVDHITSVAAPGPVIRRGKDLIAAVS